MRRLPLLAALLLLAFVAACGLLQPDSGRDGDTSLASKEDEARCGNGIREAGEACDDGNLASLDGCDSSCRFEQVMRANSLVQRFSTDAICPNNALGGAIGSAAQGEVNDSIRKDVADGDITVLLQAMNLGDLRGQNAPAFSLGNLHGQPYAGPGYDGLASPDWWYHVAPESVDASRTPTEQLSAQLTNGELRAGPGELTLGMSVGGPPVRFYLKNVVLRGTTSSVNTPALSADGGTPGHTLDENLDPALQSFASVLNGTLCGDVTAGSLAAAPVPDNLRRGGSAECNEGYTDRHTFLDVVVSGCTVFLVKAIKKTQPDRYWGEAPRGGKYLFTKDSARFVTGCTDGNGTALNLQHCLQHALYSTYFGYTANRVMARMPPPPAPVDAGTPDAGELDAGSPEQDGGVEPGDAGTEDAGMPELDAGVPSDDAGIPEEDAGTSMLTRR